MSENKTKPTAENVIKFLNAIDHSVRRTDAFRLNELISEITEFKPVMWGSSIVGYGFFKYKTKSGREDEWFMVGFSPRKQSLSLYLMCGFEKVESILKRLGKYKTGKGCLYVNKLADIDESVLKELIEEAVRLNSEH